MGVQNYFHVKPNLDYIWMSWVLTKIFENWIPYLPKCPHVYNGFLYLSRVEKLDHLAHCLWADKLCAGNNCLDRGNNLQRDSCIFNSKIFQFHAFCIRIYLPICIK